MVGNCNPSRVVITNSHAVALAFCGMSLARQHQMADSRRTWPIALLGVVCFIAGTLQGTDTVRAAWEPIAAFLSLQGAPAASSANVLSEHEIDLLDSMEPQSQAELLLERSINHFQGANEQIMARVERWLGHIKIEGRLNGLFTTALNSDDLRVRAAAIEVNLAGRKVAKSVASVDRLEAAARAGDPRAKASNSKRGRPTLGRPWHRRTGIAPHAAVVRPAPKVYIAPDDRWSDWPRPAAPHTSGPTSRSRWCPWVCRRC